MADTPTLPRIWVSSVTFSDGSVVELGSNDRVLVIGPNNSGKSASLQTIAYTFENFSHPGVVLSDIRFGQRGTAQDIIACAKQSSWASVSEDGSNIAAFHDSASLDNLDMSWSKRRPGFGALLAGLFCHHVKGADRLTYSDPQKSLDSSKHPPTHPLHILYRDKTLEEMVARNFRRAFGTDLVVNRFAGSVVRLHVGNRPEKGPNEDTSDLSYVQKIENLQPLESQGDGMRSFASVLLATSLGRESLLLVDEPEAFLHPPQARVLGELLAQPQTVDRQLIVATHSSDVLKGFLDGGGEHVQVIRLHREGQVNHVCKLASKDTVSLWTDSVLRESNVFDGLFHEQVVVCEGDSDCRFYGAVFNAITAGSSSSRPPDTMFVHCGGKDRLALVANALRRAGVPVRVIADIDLLNDSQKFRSVIEALGGEWSEFEGDLRRVTQAIQEKKPELTAGDVHEVIEAQFKDQEPSEPLPPSKRIQIQKALKSSTVWANVKEGGSSFIPRGRSSFGAFESLVSKARNLGLNIVEVGEMEGFVRTVDMKSAKWVNEVLTMDLAKHPDLEAARRFVKASCVDSLP